MDLHVCMVTTELFAWGKYGGIGMCTRMIGKELTRRGVQVSVIVPRGVDQKPVETLDRMTVYSHPLSHYPLTGELYREIDADIYHSEGLNWGTDIAYNAVRDAGHLLTFQNPRTDEEWEKVYKYYPLRRRLFNKLFSGRLAETVHRMGSVYCQAKYLIPKVQGMYGLDSGFLPNPVSISGKVVKSDEPTVCFLGRFDGEKQPHLFFELARYFPEVHFIAVGAAHNPEVDKKIRARYSDIPNLEFPGFKEGSEKDRILEKSWILVNTSVSEGLPVSFLEAAAHQCAILSPHDPDEFASNFGYHVHDDFEEGLRVLLDDDNWRIQGSSGYNYVSRVHELGKVGDMHIEAYNRLLS